MRIRKLLDRKILDILINGSMVAQFDVTSWAPLGNWCTVGAFSGSATADQYCRSFEATW